MQLIRITEFSDDQELILRPRRSGTLYGYLRPKQVIESIAHAQFQRFVESKQLVSQM